jgi:hypothetical protein
MFPEHPAICGGEGESSLDFFSEKVTAAVAVKTGAGSLDSACRIASDPTCSARDDRVGSVGCDARLMVA